MYNGHTTLDVNGRARGVDGYFNATKFQEFSGDERTKICEVPFAQPEASVKVTRVTPSDRSKS